MRRDGWIASALLAEEAIVVTVDATKIRHKLRVGMEHAMRQTCRT